MTHEGSGTAKVGARLPVAVVVFNDFQLLDASGPVAVFEAASFLSPPGSGYRVSMVSARGGPVRSSSGITLHTEALAQMPAIDTLLVAGGTGTRAADRDPGIVALLRERAGACRRVASVCTGAFLLAEAGLLEGRRATTHWRHCAQLARRHPQVRVEADRIWTRDGAVWTSAGVSAGIDLALALVGDDFGADVAQACAREVVVYYQRPGGQSQFSSIQALGGGRGRFGELLAWARANLEQPLSVDQLADRMAMSPRNFARRFRAEVGRTPAQAVMQMRLEVARTLVEGSNEPIEQIARRCGFGDAERMRRAFVRALGRPPRALRTARQASLG